MLKRPYDQARVDTLWFGNTTVTILASSADGADRVSLVEHTMPFGEAPPLHVHATEDEIFYCLEGEMAFEVGGAEFTLSAGMSALAPKGLPHRFRVISPAGARCLTICRGPDFETLLRSAGRVPSHAGLPAPAAPTPEDVVALTAACSANHIAVIGPPLG